MTTRRRLLRWLSAGLFCPPLDVRATAAIALPSAACAPPPAGRGKDVSMPPTGSDLGSLYPFIQSQAVKGEFPLSFLAPEFQDLNTWKPRARGKLLELLHYEPARGDFRAETVEKT